MAQRAVFTGLAFSILEILVIGPFYLFGLLGWIGVRALLLSRQIERDPQVVVLWLIGGALLAWWSRNVVRFLTQVRVVDIADDGTWILKGLLFRRGTIRRDEPRTVQVIGRTMTIYSGAGIRRIPLTSLAISARGRTWLTCSTRSVDQEAGTRLLAEWIARNPGV